AVCWRRAGREDRVLAALRDVKRLAGGAVSLGGREAAVFDTEDTALAWLDRLTGPLPDPAGPAGDDWLVFRGGPRRNAAAAAAVPLDDTAWHYSTLKYEPLVAPVGKQPPPEDIAAHFKSLVEQHEGTNFLDLPATYPLIIGDRAVIRTLNNVRALDLEEGRPRWERAGDDRSFSQLVENGKNVTVRRGAGSQPALEMFITQRLWRDVTNGTISSDGEQIYSVEDLGFLGFFGHNFRSPKHPLAPGEASTLMAFDLDGKLRWMIGGEEGEYALDKHAGTFFLGPPLPLDGTLYCLVEQKGEISLLALHPEDGRGLWKQTLVMPEAPLSLSPLRRMAGSAPAFGYGVMVCPTESGMVIGVDLARRRLLWGYRYD
ncbi:MAG: PQQ-binding-like beta-propeller repeat protein, partial [Planctomycetaceae bacterium]